MDVSVNGGNVDVFRDCLSASLIARSSSIQTQESKKRAKTQRRKSRKDITNHVAEDDVDADDLSDFAEYLAETIFRSLPDEVKELSYASVQDDSLLAVRYETPLDSKVLSDIMKTVPTEISDSLCSYALLDEPSSLDRFLEPVLNNYIASAIAPPPEFTPSLSASRPSGCEICSREHLPLTYHHLIPRQIHEKAVKRGWHKEWELNKVAWLCRACHSFVHKCASNEELAKNYYDVELLTQREDIQKFAGWVGKVRWKAR